MRNKKMWAAVMAAVMVAGVLTGCGGSKFALASETVNAELGEEMSTEPKEYIVFNDGVSDEDQAEILEGATVDVSAVDTETLGEYTASVTYNKKTYEFTVVVEDTTAPTATLNEGVITVDVGTTVNAADLVTGIEDAQEVTTQFVTSSVTEATLDEETADEAAEEAEDETAPKTDEETADETSEEAADDTEEVAVEGEADTTEVTLGEEFADSYTFENEGTYAITIRLTDASGNTTDLVQKVSVVIPDTTAPEISGAKDRKITVGGSQPDYLSGVTATDDVDGDVTASLTVDNSAVNTGKAGSYTVTYTAKDAAGNEATKQITVTVAKKQVKQQTTTTGTDAGSTTGQAGATGGSANTGSSGSASSGSSNSGAASSNTGSSSSGSGNSGASNSGSANSGSANSGSANSGSASSGSSSSGSLSGDELFDQMAKESGAATRGNSITGALDDGGASEREMQWH